MPVVAVPVLFVVGAAILALLILMGVKVIVDAIAHIIPSSGFPGAGALHDLLVNLATAAMAVVQWVMADVIRPVISVILAPVFRFIDFLRGLAHFATSMADSWDWLVGHELPRVFSRIRDLAGHVLDVAKAFALAKIHDLHDLLHAAIVAARAYALHLVHAAAVELHLALHAAKAALWAGVHEVRHDLTNLVDHAEHVAAAATAAVASDLARVRDNVWAGIHDARHDLAAAIDSTAAVTLHAAERFTTTSIKAIEGVIAVDIPGVIAPVWDGVIDDVGALEGVIASDFPDLSHLLARLPGADTLDLATSIAGAMTLARVATRYMTECGIPNCRNLGGVGRALQELFGLVGDAAFLAVLADLIADPAGAAAEVESVLGAIADPIISGARDLLGV